MDPFDLFNLASGILDGIWDMLHDPEQRNAMAKQILLMFVFISPWLATSIGLSRYAKRRGRDLSAVRHVRSNPTPFVEPRLNEVIDVMRRFALPIIAVAVIGGLFIVTSVGNEDVATALAVTLGLVIGGARRMFLEACVAFGAELASLPETKTLTPLAGA
jgi:Na+/H+ antiporter NhaA